eukprot:scaffold9948_cov60-Phaeocystis_antarctica.AAC.2
MGVERERARAPPLLGLAALEHLLLRGVELRHEVAALVGALRVQRPEALARRSAHRGVGVGGDGLERAEERPELLERVLQRGGAGRLGGIAPQLLREALDAAAARLVVRVAAVRDDDVVRRLRGRRGHQREHRRARDDRDGLDRDEVVLEQLRQHAGHQRREAVAEVRDERGEHGADGAHRGGAEVAELRREGRAELRQQLVEQVGGGEVGHEGGQRADGRDALLPVELLVHDAIHIPLQVLTHRCEGGAQLLGGPRRPRRHRRGGPRGRLGPRAGGCERRAGRAT